LRRYQPPVARTPQQHIADIALWALRFEAQMHYLQQRPMQDMGAPPNVDDYCDCSEFATWVFESAGVPDPNGMGYDGYGSTYSMIGRGERVVGWPEMADLVFYDNPAHVAVGVGVRSGEAMVVSHGSESGPNLTSWRYREPVAVRRYAMAA
jgi:hypothetical protein